MDKQQAKELIKKIFEQSFDKARYTVFIKNLLNIIEEAPMTYKGQYIPDAYKPFISKLERIGKFSDGEHKIDILIIMLKKETSLERARTMQRNFIAWYLNGSRGGELKDAALAAFVSPGEADWRFSLVKMDYKFETKPSGKTKVKEEFTPARRWSFLVGENERSHTAQSRLVGLLANDDQVPTLAELEEAFNIESVTREFFLKYRDLFIRTKEELDKMVKNDTRIKDDFETRGVNTVDFAKKLLGQIIFLYFLQKKGWFGVARDADWGTGPKQFLRELFEKKHGDYHNFFNDILEPLFYEALRTDRSYADDYYSRFNCKIPFLNGGLFDPIGNYDWVHTDIRLPDKLFSNNVKTKEGDTGDGILDVFDRYNFTVREDEPLEKEVAIDPELLGKAYEKFNAIRPDNFEEYIKALKSGKKGDESKFNKQYGVYYTPRDIVHYMCRQSLINYLHTELNQSTSSYQKVGEAQTNAFGNKVKTGQLDLTIEHASTPGIAKEDIETLIQLGEHISENEARVLIEGRETKTYSYKLPESIRSNAGLIDRKLEDIMVCDPAVGSGAFPVGMMSEIFRARTVLTTFIETKTNRTPYYFKRRCIEHSLYGVDIDPGAVEIAKLRLWLSLVVDEEDIKNIKPLPNLDYKIVCGNSLLGYPYKPRGLEEIEILKEEFFKEVNPTRKNELRNQIDDAIYGLFRNSEKSLGYKVTMDFKINFSEVFRVKSGFDVVIANPPYIKEDVNKKAFDGLRSSECYQGKMDLWYLFGSKGLDILKRYGIICYIAINNWISNDGASKFRNKIIKQGRIINFVDFGNYKIFSAGVQTMVFVIIKDNEPKQYITRYGRLINEKADNMMLDKYLKCNNEIINDEFNLFNFLFNRADFYNNYINFINPINATILKKMKCGDLFYLADNEIFSGIDVMQDFVNKDHKKILGDKFSIGDGIFVLKDKEKTQISWNNLELNLIRPYYTTQEINKYYSNIDNKYWIIYTGAEVNSKIENYPNIKKHLDKFQNIITSVNKPYGLHRTRDNKIFIGEKILSIRKCFKPSFSFVDFPCYVSRAFLIINSDRISLKYLLGILNSRLIGFWLFHQGKLQGNMLQVDKVPLMKIPIVKVNKEKQNFLVNLVDMILKQTESVNYLYFEEKQNKIKDCEHEIDQLVYQFYGLNEKEIKIVEGNIQ